MQAMIGDKVRLKLPGKTDRGRIERIHNSRLTVRLDDGRAVVLKPEQVVNFSLAARKAWQKMPSRRVGRPKGSRTTDRISVTLRIDRDLWQLLQRLEAAGLVESRTSTVNDRLRDVLNQLIQKRSSNDDTEET